MTIAKDKRAKKLGVPPGTLWSNDQDPVLIVSYCLSVGDAQSKSMQFQSSFRVAQRIIVATPVTHALSGRIGLKRTWQQRVKSEGSASMRKLIRQA